MGNKSFLYNLDNDKIINLLNDTYDNCEQLINITSNVIKTYTEDLDKLMGDIRNQLTNKDIEIPINILEDLMLQLNDKLYFIGSKLEVVGIQDDVAKAAKQEIYNKAYLNNDIESINAETGKRVKPTKDSNSAIAEEKSKYETIIYNIFDRTYKVIKIKIEAGYEMLSSIKKIISRRIQEMQTYQNKNNN